NPDVPESLSNLVMKLLNKDRNERPASAKDASKELQAIGKDLVRGVSKSGPMPVVVGVPEANPWQDIDATEVAQASADAAPSSSETLVTVEVDVKHISKKKLLIAVGLCGFVAAVLAGVILIIRGPNGRDTTVNVPDGSTVPVDPKGKVAVELPKPAKPPLA